ncbi:MAG: hypothetical protein KAS23_07220, partial [Anaerohalosphaera sp.]|nr:hypothetical protein [Anaerohalosphaera sp.]
MILLNYPGHIIAVTLAVIIAAFILFSYRHKSVRRVRLRVIPLALLQFTAFLIVLFILWNPVIAEMTESKTRNSVLLLFDTSESMSVANNGAKSRLDNAVDLFIKKFSPDDPEGPVFEIYGFDRDYYYAGSLDGLVRWGDKSSLISPIELLAKQSALNGDANRGSGSVHGKVAGAIIFTDGQVLDKNMSLYPSADELEFPVAVVGVGSSNAQYDLAVKSMKTPGRAAMNTSFVVEITVGSINEGSENVIIELLEDEQVISSREIPAKDISEDMAVSFNVAADKPGAHSLVARIGSNQNEINRANNSRAAIYEVIDDRKINVLFYSQVANFDVGKIRQALSRDEKVRLDMKMDVIIPQMNKYYDSQVKLPSSTNGYDDYDVVILGPCMGDALDEMQIESLYRFVADRGGGLILLPGHGVMDSSSWKNDKLRRLVPAFSDIDDPTQKYDMRKVSLSPGGMNSKFVEQSLFETYKPEAMAFKSSMRKKPAATSFASIDNTPALVVHRIGRGKVCMVNISRLFHWYREDLEGGFLRVFMSGLTE